MTKAMVLISNNYDILNTFILLIGIDIFFNTVIQSSQVISATVLLASESLVSVSVVCNTV